MSQRSTKQASFITPSRLSLLSPCEEDKMEGTFTNSEESITFDELDQSPSITVERNELFQFGFDHLKQESDSISPFLFKEFEPREPISNSVKYND